ncbi:hypothetical protein B296_00049580 [Ensete ventricosum]|uniref:Uncharacterized protein n=1 Tax=Ensete ventricosum TaxID=4639 RepID=A0A426Y3I0_ENSVE|nr:hypothetical protein B296_00049580 [Ensete ventricosum]
MARPSTGVAGHGLATCKRAIGYGQGPLQRGDRLWPRPPTQGVADCGQPVGAAVVGGNDHLQWGARRSDQPARGCHQQGQRRRPQGDC